MPKNPLSNFQQLAAEALDLWQEHLATLASDPKAKAELAQLIEPSRRMFAEWMEKAQVMPHGTAPFTANPDGGSSHRPTPVQPASDDGALRVAELTLRVAELEKRMAILESAQQHQAAAKPRGPSRRRKPSGT